MSELSKGRKLKRQKRNLVVVTAVAGLMIIASPALAHIGTNPGEVPAGGSSTVGFRVGHGCDDSPTVAVSMEIPAGVTSVTPKAKPGWTIETETGTLPEPVDIDGETVSEGVVRVTWTGGSLDPHQFDEFEIRARMPDAEGETVYFPMVQTCEEGEYAWIQIPEEGGEEPESPAPGVVLIASAGGGHGSSTEGATGNGSSDGIDAVSWAALVLGGLGAVLGGVAFANSRQRQ